jgi:hypothetical protein
MSGMDMQGQARTGTTQRVEETTDMVEGVSVHAVRVFIALVDAGDEWLTSIQASARAEVGPRSTRQHLRKLSSLGVVDKAKVFPGYRYRLARAPEGRGAEHLQRLHAARAVVGI